MSNEAETCGRFVVTRLQAVGWDSEPHRLDEQITFTGDRIIGNGRKGRRPGKRVHYILRYHPDMRITVVGAKPIYAKPECVDRIAARSDFPIRSHSD